MVDKYSLTHDIAAKRPEKIERRKSVKGVNFLL